MKELENNFLIEVIGNEWRKATLLTATHRLIEEDWETDQGLPVFGLYDLDGNLVGHRLLEETDYLQVWSDDE